ncbi:hypothetical protein ATCC90586_005552 [Pythium insidiosum]|nr:hypothetical protein ATCC90586_005552 [Pythium insidiosum]
MGHHHPHLHQHRPSLRRPRPLAACAFAWLLVLTTVVNGGNIDQGYTQDGVTTYCQGVRGGAGPNALAFPELFPHSAGRCPIDVALKASTTMVRQREPVTVTWSATVRQGDVPNNIFPSAVDPNSKRAKDIQSSFIKACKAGTNCAAIIDGTPDGPGADTGPFDDKGKKELKGYRFTFNDVGDYVIVGKVVLPGDPKLNVSASEFLVFQKIAVVDPKTPLTTAPAPAPTTQAPSAKSQDGKNNSSPTAAPPTKNSSNEVAEIAAVESPVPPSPDSSGARTTSSEEVSKGFFATHGAVVAAVIASCAVVGLIGFFVVRRRRTAQQTLAAKSADVFRVTDTDNDDPEHQDAGPSVTYVRKKSVRSVNESLPIMSRPSSGSVEDSPIDISKRGSELDPSFDIGPIHKIGATGAAGAANHRRSSSFDAKDSMAASSLAGTGDHHKQRDYFESEVWHQSESSMDFGKREMSTMSEVDSDLPDSNSRRGGGFAESYASQGMFNEADEDRETAHRHSQASVDSYAFRPSGASVADSYGSRMSHTSGLYDDSMYERESSRISSMSFMSDRESTATDV